jgi:hypothetical protein
VSLRVFELLSEGVLRVIFISLSLVRGGMVIQYLVGVNKKNSYILCFIT